MMRGTDATSRRRKIWQVVNEVLASLQAEFGARYTNIGVPRLHRSG